SSCTADPRDLHSFPTRRSSDLHGAESLDRLVLLTGLDDEDERELRAFEVELRLLWADRVGDGRVVHEHGPVEGSARPGLHLSRRDRKSTRLNSSHLVISYAVFC